MNTVIESVLLIKKLEIVQEINQCYEWAKKYYGDAFDEVMRDVIDEMSALQSKCKAGTTYFKAAWLCTMQGDPGMTKEDNELVAKSTKASIAYMAFRVYELEHGNESINRDEALDKMLII